MNDYFDPGTTFSLKLSEEYKQKLDTGQISWNETYYIDDTGLWQRCVLAGSVGRNYKDRCACYFSDEDMFSLIDEGKLKFNEDRKISFSRPSELPESKGILNISLEEGLEALRG